MSLKEKITKIRKGTQVSQIMVSRVVKTRNGGDVFVSLTGNYESEPLSLEESRLAAHLLSLEVNILGFQQAGASGLLTESQMNMAISKTKGNFAHLITSMESKDD
jgi:hypothetical protein